MLVEGAYVKHIETLIYIAKGIKARNAEPLSFWQIEIKGAAFTYG